MKSKKKKQVTKDTWRLDALESIPYRIEIKYSLSELKTSDMPSLRSQIDYFLKSAGFEDFDA